MAEKGKSSKQWIEGLRRSMVSKDFTEEDAEDKELW